MSNYINNKYTIDHMYDIYTTNDCITSYHTHNSIRHFITDYSNVIILDPSMIQHKKIPYVNNDLLELICSQCTRPSVFIWHVNSQYLCPLCAFNSTKNCSVCNLSAGCHSCGGNTNMMVRKMYNNKLLTLCANDVCLMPFGFYINNHNLSCSCYVDALIVLYHEIPLDLFKLIKSYMLPSLYDDQRITGIKLSDLSRTIKNKCQLCQLQQKYKLIYHHEIITERVLCNCINKN